jgi:hypothetical protein
VDKVVDGLFRYFFTCVKTQRNQMTYLCAMAFVVYLEAKEWEALEWQGAIIAVTVQLARDLFWCGFLQVWDGMEKIGCESRDIDNINDNVDTTKPKKSKEYALVYYSHGPDYCRELIWETMHNQRRKIMTWKLMQKGVITMSIELDYKQMVDNIFCTLNIQSEIGAILSICKTTYWLCLN